MLSRYEVVGSTVAVLHGGMCSRVGMHAIDHIVGGVGKSYFCSCAVRTKRDGQHD